VEISSKVLQQWCTNWIIKTLHDQNISVATDIGDITALSVGLVWTVCQCCPKCPLPVKWLT